MGSSETGVGVVDCSVGSLVWVRRRNGSWWPGKILGPEELSSSHLTSPRSGAPVKLLGREDASVDWYNLEKSKRVKSFRCGEFDDCIGKVEDAQGMPPKKREKYARREDAIMHALELERQLEKKYGKFGNTSNSRSRRSPDAVTISVFLGNGSGNQNDSRSDQPRHKVGSSLAEKNVTDQNMYEYSAGVLPRMRGLQDFGLRTARQAREEISGVARRTKISTHAHLSYDSGDYLIDDQTLCSQLEIPVSKIEESGYPAGVCENHISGSTEDTETDSSKTDSLESDSDDENTAFSDGSGSIELQPKYHRRIEEHASISSSDDVAFTDSLSRRFSHGHVSTGTDTSGWKLEGKINNPNLGKRCLGSADKTLRNHASRYGSNIEGLARNSRPAMRGYYSGGGRSMLIDVDLRVQANNYHRDVPMISLMSKLNGHAIVGHPIQIEVSAMDYFTPGLRENHTPLTSVWRTGRRTANSRVPRPFLSTKGPNGKIRSLSSFSSEKHRRDSIFDGLIKNGNAPAAVACIPVKLVFSRLHEEFVGGHL